jgi:hypothetical protein
MIHKIFIVGNDINPTDSIPIKILPELKIKYKNIIFELFDPTEDINNENKSLILIDSVLNLDRVTIFSDINNFICSPRFSVHDYDLMLDLSIQIKLKKIDKIIIIGVPSMMSEKEAFQQICFSIKSILPEENVKRSSYRDHTLE